ncbi:MAG: hypothetical protein KKA54_16870 [Proteobacteria bacterium]|nr:hypothetical protein [Pseudomonadota bacterium]
MKRYFKAIALTSTIAVPFMLTTAAFAGDHKHDYDKHHDHKKCVNSNWLTGDFHQHTLYTDGSTTFDFVMEKNNEFGLDWWANSEHGGARNRDGEGVSWLDTSKYPVNPILGDFPEKGYMYRWQSLRDFAYPDIERNRDIYPDKKIAAGVEWNVPGHEHCSSGIVAKDPGAISAWEYIFDKSDDDTSRDGEVTPYGVLAKENGKIYEWVDGSKIITSKSTEELHADAVAGCAWMQQQLDAGKIDGGWIVFAHIERNGAWSTGGYDINNFRDFNNAGPDVCFGFEGAPGHQANSSRGGFSTTKAFGGTYGGTGYYTATLGGLWDALLGEGRHWYNFASSDYHSHHTAGGDDFYPGEYQKTWTKAVDADRDGDISLKEIAAGLRSGNSFHVMGDLINALEFTASYNYRVVEMGGDLQLSKRHAAKDPLVIKIKFMSPVTNNNGDTPVVDHIDLIAGQITGLVSPDSPDYTKATNESTQVLATFTSADWEIDEDGYNVITYPIKGLDKSMYFRLRGTNQPVNAPFETDEMGNPLADSLATAGLGLDGAEEAWADLWFYSNPIFVNVDK